MSETLWGQVPGDVTRFQVQKCTSSGRKVETCEIETADQGDRTKWAPIGALTRDFLIAVTGGGDCHVRLFWQAEGAPVRDRGRGTSPVFFLAAQQEPKAAKRAAEPAPVLPREQPSTPWEMMIALDAMHARRSEATIAALRADADARIRAAEAQAQAQIAMQTNFFVALEKAKAEIAASAPRGGRDPELAAALDRLGKRLDDLEDGEDEPDDGEETPAAGLGQVFALFDSYDSASGEIDWRAAAEALGPNAVEELKPVWEVGKDLIKAKFVELAKKMAPPAAAK